MQTTASAGLLGLAGCAAQGAKAVKASGNPNALKLGLAGAKSTDSLDPRTFTNTFSFVVGYQIMNGLIEIDESRKATPELLESWEVKPGAADWVFSVRKGVTFHNGKSLDADDIIYSINLHRTSSKSVAAGNVQAIADIRKLDNHQIAITLNEGNADFPHFLGDYQLLVVPDGFDDWSHPIGTGAFRFESFTPGVSASTVRNPNYWKAGRGRVDAVESRVINDEFARMSALKSGEVDIINRVGNVSAANLSGVNGVEIVRAPGGYHAEFYMQIDASPFDKIEVRRAFKAAVDREAMVKVLFDGHGRVGNDHPIPETDPFFNNQLPQTVYDPEKAKFYLKQAGLSTLSIDLWASNAAFDGAPYFADQFADQAARTGIKMDVKATHGNAFWDDIWMVKPFVASYWGGRPAATQMLEVAYASNARWNETHWRNGQFDDLLKTAKTELDQAKRKQAIWEMQAMLHDDGGAIIPAFKDWVDAHGKRVKGHTPHSMFDLDNGRIAEKVWLEG
jgi:peptide/nickel transport system substrate-binding protein